MTTHPRGSRKASRPVHPGDEACGVARSEGLEPPNLLIRSQMLRLGKTAWAQPWATMIRWETLSPRENWGLDALAEVAGFEPAMGLSPKPA